MFSTTMARLESTYREAIKPVTDGPNINLILATPRFVKNVWQVERKPMFLPRICKHAARTMAVCSLSKGGD
jgi:hypothetical protein